MASPNTKPEYSDVPQVVTVQLRDLARNALDDIKRSFESDAEVINRILETLAASATDFDHFYSAPHDGRGPSGV